MNLFYGPVLNIVIKLMYSKMRSNSIDIQFCEFLSNHCGPTIVTYGRRMIKHKPYYKWLIAIAHVHSHLHRVIDEKHT